MIVLFFLPIGDVDCNEIGVFGVVHVEKLLLISALGFGFVVVRLGLFALRLEVLAGGVILGLGLAQVGVAAIPVGFELLGVIGMALAKLFETAAVELQGLSNLRYEVGGKAIVLASTRLECRELGGPSRQGSTVIQKP